MWRVALLFFVCISWVKADEQAVLAAISAGLAKAEITQGDFQQQKQLTILKKPLLSTGRFTCHQGKGVIWQTLTPVSSLLLLNDNKLLTNQGQQSLPPAFGLVFKALLSADLTGLHKRFEITATHKKSGWRAELISKDALLRNVMARIILTGDSELRSLEIDEADGNKTQITFHQINHPLQLTDEQETDFVRLNP